MYAHIYAIVDVLLHNLKPYLKNMASTRAFQITVIGSLSLGSFLAGSYYEKKRARSGAASGIHVFKDYNGNYRKDLSYDPEGPRLWGNYSSIPIFASVSAATGYSPAVQESSINRTSQIMRFGFPGMDNLRSFDDYILSYDRRNRVAHWVFEHLTQENLKYGEGVDRSKCDFVVDESIHKYFR